MVSIKLEHLIQKCPSCSSDETTVAYDNSFFDLPVLKCKNCSLFFTLQNKKDNEVREYYNDSYWSVFRNIKNIKIENQKFDDAYIIKKLPKTLRNILERTGVRKSLSYSQYNYLKPYVKGKNLFEIGSGEGFLLEIFEKNGFNVYGIEPSKINIEIINKKLKHGKCENQFVENLSFSNEKFDVIIMSHVLEHLIDAKIILTNIRTGLTKNGILFIEVPNCQHKKTLDHSIETQPHMYHFTKESLEIMLESIGYKILLSETFKAEVFSFIQHLSYLLNWFFKRDFYKKVSGEHGNRLRVIATHTDN